MQERLRHPLKSTRVKANAFTVPLQVVSFACDCDRCFGRCTLWTALLLTTAALSLNLPAAECARVCLIAVDSCVAIIVSRYAQLQIAIRVSQLEPVDMSDGSPGLRGWLRTLSHCRTLRRRGS